MSASACTLYSLYIWLEIGSAELIFDFLFGLVSPKSCALGSESARFDNKSSAAAKIGDCLATIDMGQKGGLLCPFPEGGRAEPHLTQCGLCRDLPSHQVAFWSIQPFGHNSHGLKIGGCAPLKGAAGSPSNTMWPGPRPTSITSGILIHPANWPQQTWVENWRAVLPLLGGAGSPCNTMWRGLRPTPVPSGILIHAAVWPQHEPKLGVLCLPFWEGEWGLHLTQCRLGCGLPLHQVAS